MQRLQGPALSGCIEAALLVRQKVERLPGSKPCLEPVVPVVPVPVLEDHRSESRLYQDSLRREGR